MIPKCIVSVIIRPCIDMFPSIETPKAEAECYPRSITLNDNSQAKYVFWPEKSNSLLMSWQTLALTKILTTVLFFQVTGLEITEKNRHLCKTRVVIILVPSH